MAILYTDVANNQKDGNNFPGGGMTTQPGQYNDPVAELGTLSLPICIYTMTGNEVQNDIIYVTRLTMGAYVDPTRSNVAGNGVGTTASVQIGDTDTVGGTVSPNQTRYSTAIAVSADMSATAPVAYAGGAALIAPAEITDDPVWVTAKFSVLSVPVAGKVLVFRTFLTDNR